MTGERLRVAFLGGRGIPARYGGFNSLIEELPRGSWENLNR